MPGFVRHFGVVVYVTNLRERRFAFINQNDDGHWVPPAGISITMKARKTLPSGR